MKRIIDGRVYDTDNAELIANISPLGFSTTDLRWQDTGLYRTLRGQWFIAGRGGAASRWSQESGQNGRVGGEGLKLIGIEEARRLAETYCPEMTEDDYKRLFGEIEQG